MSSLIEMINFVPSPAIQLFSGAWRKDSQPLAELYTPVTKPVERTHGAIELKSLKSDLADLFEHAKRETFEDGIHSAFSIRLTQAVMEHGEAAINQVSLLVESGSISPTVLAETLKWLGNMDSHVAYERRRWLLEYCLSYPSVVVRDGAIVGVSYLEDPDSIGALERARQKEKSSTLKADIDQVIDD